MWLTNLSRPILVYKTLQKNHPNKLDVKKQNKVKKKVRGKFYKIDIYRSELIVSAVSYFCHLPNSLKVIKEITPIGVALIYSVCPHLTWRLPRLPDKDHTGSSRLKCSCSSYMKRKLKREQPVSIKGTL